MRTFVIVGASLAGATAAATLRAEGFDGRVILIGAESHPPYKRPPLSKGYLRGKIPVEKTRIRSAEFYEQNGIETRLGSRVTRVDPRARSVELEANERVGYDKVLIATGGRNRRVPIPGLDMGGVYDLRTIGDADRIRAEITPGRRAVVVGMGFIGSEVAASLREAGLEVVVIEVAQTPLVRVLGEEVGRVIEGIHRDHGVQMIFEDSVASFEGVGRVERVRTKAGRRIECDFVVVGVGIEPVTDLVAGAGVTVDNGILVAEYSRTTVEGIYAAGDVANHYHPVFRRHIRVEHWQNALKQGEAAARSMLGKGSPYADVHWFWSDQFDASLQYAGFHTEWDELVVRGSLKGRRFVAFYLKDGRVDAAVAIDNPGELRDSMSLIESRALVEPKSLRDEDFDLREEIIAV